MIEITTENIDKIGNILYNIRDQAQVAQGDIAAIMKRDPSQISGWENNHKIPGLRSLVAYLNVLGRGWKLAIVREEDDKN